MEADAAAQQLQQLEAYNFAVEQLKQMQANLGISAPASPLQVQTQQDAVDTPAVAVFSGVSVEPTMELVAQDFEETSVARDTEVADGAEAAKAAKEAGRLHTLVEAWKARLVAQVVQAAEEAANGARTTQALDVGEVAVAQKAAEDASTVAKVAKALKLETAAKAAKADNEAAKAAAMAKAFKAEKIATAARVLEITTKADNLAKATKAAKAATAARVLEVAEAETVEELPWRATNLKAALEAETLEGYKALEDEQMSNAARAAVSAVNADELAMAANALVSTT